MLTIRDEKFTLLKRQFIFCPKDAVAETVGDVTSAGFSRADKVRSCQAEAGVVGGSHGVMSEGVTQILDAPHAARDDGIREERARVPFGNGRRRQ